MLYFYPKDDTPGCTVQACALRDRYAHLKEQNALAFGISVDSPASHKKFIEKYSLPFPLLSDESHALVEDYGVWVRKACMGKNTWGRNARRS